MSKSIHTRIYMIVINVLVRTQKNVVEHLVSNNNNNKSGDFNLSKMAATAVSHFVGLFHK